MRVRALDSDGDMTFGRNSDNFLVDSTRAVGQCVSTRLQLWQGEWFIDLTEGTPYMSKILGTHGINQYDQALSLRILQTPGVISLESYQSFLDPSTRLLSVSATVNTLFGFNLPLVISLTLPG
jgi:hypothetical protein